MEVSAVAKYQVRINDGMADTPASPLLSTFEEATERLEQVRQIISETWASPDPDAAYIYINRRY